MVLSSVTSERDERDFILDALEQKGVRADGRQVHDLRPIRLHFGRSHGKSHAEVQLAVPESGLW